MEALERDPSLAERAGSNSGAMSVGFNQRPVVSTHGDVFDTLGKVHSGSDLRGPVPLYRNASPVSDGSIKSDSPDTAPTPQLNYVNWAQFKNSTVGANTVYAIDVLVGPAKFYWQRRLEELHYQGRAASQHNSDGIPPLSKADAVSGPQLQAHNSTMTGQNVTNNEMPERIRINCRKLLAVLEETTESSIGKESTVLLRPYKLLVRHDSAIRQRLRHLEMQDLKSPERSTEDGTPKPYVKTSTNDDQPPPRQKSLHLDESVGDRQLQEEMRSLQCLVQFMDSEIVPVHQRYRSSDLKKVYFRDLWFLYRPGDLVVSWKDLDEEDSILPNQPTGKGPPIIWRVLSVSRGRPVLGLPHGHEGDRLRPPSIKINKFTILCHIISYDGVSYGPLDHTFSISPFDGQKELGVLDPCPLRYVADRAEIEERLVNRGKKFVKYSKPTHSLYIGNTLRNHPCGLTCKAEPKSIPVDGPVIVDFREAKRDNPHWVVNHGMPTASGGSGLETMEDYPNTIWKDEARLSVFGTKPDSLFEDDEIDAADMDDFVVSNTFLAAHKYSSGEMVIDSQAFDRTDFALLPDRVVGFDLHRRGFAILALECLHPVQINKEGWTNLKLPRGHKHMVQAQIKTHFLQKQSRKKDAFRNPDADIIRGKGMGLIILLHGAPGVGKTSTAECVAESLNKPLYPITCGDLGITAPEVETRLNNTFAKAETWDCVLLLDEADVFLAQRTRTDLKRNAIVSVFLRVLEYYKGILILTTNRVGAFDEAFKSRIHLHLYYPALNKDQTAAIWRMNLDRIIHHKKGRVTANEHDIMRFAETHFEQHKNKSTRWNGRQIRNAFQTALAMAEYEALEAAGLADNWGEDVALEDLTSQLKVTHFKDVADASSQFDMYIEETIGNTDSKRAFMDRDRADHFTYMMPVNAQSSQYNAQSVYEAQGPSGPYTQAWSHPFASSPRVRRGEAHSPQPPASMPSAFHQGQAVPGAHSSTWAGMGSSSSQSSQDPNLPQAYLARSTGYGSAYTHGSGMQPPISSEPPELFGPQAPISTGTTLSRDEDGY